MQIHLILLKALFLHRREGSSAGISNDIVIEDYLIEEEI